jgi:hypothetical protein
MEKYKSLADFYKFGFGRYPGFTRSTNLVGRITDTRQSFVFEGWDSRGYAQITAAEHAYHPIESDGRMDRKETGKFSIRHGVFSALVVRECRKRCLRDYPQG